MKGIFIDGLSKRLLTAIGIEELKSIVPQAKDLVDYFLGRNFYYVHGYNKRYLEWDIKVYYPDFSGKQGPEKVSDDWDPLWDKYIETYDNFFWDCCQNVLGFVGDEKERSYSWHSGIAEIEGYDYDLRQGGRSGGHLILVSFGGIEWNFGRFENYKEEIEEINEWICSANRYIAEGIVDDNLFYLMGEEHPEYADDYAISYVKEFKVKVKDIIEELTPLKVFVQSLDKFDAVKEWNNECNYQRTQLEENWERGDFDCFDDQDLREVLEERKISRNIRLKITNYLKRR